MDISDPNNMYSSPLYGFMRSAMSLITDAYMDIITNSDYYPRIVDYKANCEALELMQRGLDNYKDGEKSYFCALEDLSKAIAKAPEDDVSVSQVYFWRAMLLEQFGYYFESAQDISRALSYNVPEGIDREGWQRKQSLLLNRRRKRLLPNGLPRNTAPPSADFEVHERCSCASKQLEFYERPYEHPCVFARSCIPGGSCIVSEKASVLHPYRRKTPLFCHECMRFSVNPIPCSQCTVLFCGEYCKQFAWEAYHKYECKILSTLDKYYEGLLALKIVLSLREFIKSPFNFPNARLDKYGITHLIWARAKRNIRDSRAMELSTFAAQVFHAVVTYTDFFDDMQHPVHYDIFQGLLTHFVIVCDGHSFEGEEELTYKEHKYLVEYDAIYNTTRFFRESCSPNTAYCLHDTVLEIRTLRNIEPGEELTIRNDFHYSSAVKYHRQQYFMNHYSRNCECEACEFDWPLESDLQYRHAGSVYFNIRDSLTWLDRDPLDPDLMSCMFQEYTNMAKRIDWIRPSAEWFHFEQGFNKVLAHMWSCEHHIFDFLRKFPKTVLMNHED